MVFVFLNFLAKKSVFWIRNIDAESVLKDYNQLPEERLLDWIKKYKENVFLYDHIMENLKKYIENKNMNGYNRKVESFFKVSRLNTVEAIGLPHML